MSLEKDIFSFRNFESIVSEYCDALEIKPQELAPNFAILNFAMDSGSTQTVILIRHGSIIEFSCASGAVFDSKDEIPHELSTIMLVKNRESKIGFWCIQEIEERFHYALMHNVDIADLKLKLFKDILSHLIDECDEFEGGLEELLEMHGY